jgi:hypothetical protein
MKPPILNGAVWHEKAAAVKSGDIGGSGCTTAHG